VPADALEVVIDREAYWLDRTPVCWPESSPVARGEPHNVARPVFVARILDALAEQVVERLNQTRSRS